MWQEYIYSGPTGSRPYFVYTPTNYQAGSSGAIGGNAARLYPDSRRFSDRHTDEPVSGTTKLHCRLSSTDQCR